jgi:hypothetical protein
MVHPNFIMYICATGAGKPDRFAPLSLAEMVKDFTEFNAKVCNLDV